MSSKAHLLIIGEREALAWVLREQRMAFPARRQALAETLRVDDELLIYTSRGCFHNPTRDRGRIIGRATVTSPVVSLRESLRFNDRLFPVGCEIRMQGLAPFGQGVELSPLVDQLSVFPSRHSWTATMRRPLLTLPHADAELLRSLVLRIEQAPSQSVGSYLVHAHA